MEEKAKKNMVKIMVCAFLAAFSGILVGVILPINFLSHEKYEEYKSLFSFLRLFCTFGLVAFASGKIFFPIGAQEKEEKIFSIACFILLFFLVLLLV